MKSMDLLLRGWAHAYDKEDWYPPLKDALNGLTAAQAGWRPTGEAANTIWENVNHLIYYKKRLLELLIGAEPDHSTSSNDDTFQTQITHGTEQDWHNTLAELESVHQKIGDELSSKTDEDMSFLIRNHPLGYRVNSIILHDAFHTGQIVQIRKLQGSWPARRSFE